VQTLFSIIGRMSGAGRFRGKRARRWSAWAFVLPLIVFAAAARAASADTPDSDESGKSDRSNDISVLVDGQLRHTWSVGELMKGRFDWKTSNRRFHPAVPLVFVIDAPESGVARAAIREVRIHGKDAELTLRGADLALLDALLFKLNIGRSGTWDLAARDETSERRVHALLGEIRLRRLDRIEILSHSGAADGDPS
jgi:hypothetical protein